MKTINTIAQAFAQIALTDLQRASGYNKELFYDLVKRDLEDAIHNLEAALGAATTELKVINKAQGEKNENQKWSRQR